MTPEKSKTLRILLVDDHQLTRDEVRAVIHRHPDLTVIAESRTGEEAIIKAREVRPDIIVMDILLPGINGISTTRKILAELPDTKILALSNHSGDSLIQAVMDAGALGYVRKNKAFQELVPALRTVAANQKYVSPEAIDPKP